MLIEPNGVWTSLIYLDRLLKILFLKSSPISLRNRELLVGNWTVSAVVFPYFPIMHLIKAARNNDLDRVRLLVELGADKDQGDNDGCTPLWCASGNGHLEVAQYLVEQGATLDKTNTDGWTPLIIAAIRGHLEIARYLLEQGADRVKATTLGYTPLHQAANYGHLEIAMLLMSYGADLNARTTHSGRLPSDMAQTEEIKQAIRDEPRRRMDHGHKRATEQDRHSNAATSASAHHEEEEEREEENEQSNKRPRLNDEGALAVAEVEEFETKVAEEDEDSEPSDDENDD